jgi:ferredoxin
LVLVIGLSLAEHRAWCRNLCPLGGLLGVLSKLPGARRLVDAETCTSCARCAKACPTDAIARKAGYASSSAECIVCMRCIDACPTGANAFRLAPPNLLAPAYEPSRRDALIAVGATGLGVAAVVLPIARADAEILRPPSTSQARLAELCVRCGACYSACPTGSLRPSVSFTSEAGPWTPMLDERPAHCTMNCNRCAVPCPTDAIHTPTQIEYAAEGLGLRAEVDKTRCRAWAKNHVCMQCQSTCPISGALVGTERPANLPTRDGAPPVEVPVVNLELCVGCNQCSLSCVMTPAAIGSPLPPHDASTDDRPQMPPTDAPEMPGYPGTGAQQPPTE